MCMSYSRHVAGLLDLAGGRAGAGQRAARRPSPPHTSDATHRLRDPPNLHRLPHRPRSPLFCAEPSRFRAARPDDDRRGAARLLQRRRGRGLADAAAGGLGRDRSSSGARPCSPGSSPTSAPSSASRTAATCASASAAATPAEGIALGASIACDGICLTVVDRGPDGDGAWFDVDLSAETVARTNVRRGRTAWAEGRRVNLERALRLGDELGGHIVSGHVDGLAEVLDLRARGRQRPLPLPRPRRARPLRRAEGLGRAQRHLADRERGRGRRLRRQPDPAHPRGHHLGRGAARATSSTSRSTRSRATSPGWPTTPRRDPPRRRAARRGPRRGARPRLRLPAAGRASRRTRGRRLRKPASGRKYAAHQIQVFSIPRP